MSGVLSGSTHVAVKQTGAGDLRANGGSGELLSLRPQPRDEIDRAGVPVLGDVVGGPLEESAAGVVADQHPCGASLDAGAAPSR
jgi:hypothetical protein